MAAQLRRRGVACWSYCLMPNHGCLILVPKDETGLALGVGEAHRRYSGFVGVRGRWTGHLFQGRFASTAMDEDHLLAALRYVALNPVKARLVEWAEDWPWSSTRALIAGVSDAYVKVGPALERVGDFAAFLARDADGEADEGRWERLLAAEAVGRPVGAEGWVKDLEAWLGIPLAPGKRRSKPKAARRRMRWICSGCEECEGVSHHVTEIPKFRGSLKPRQTHDRSTGQPVQFALRRRLRRPLWVSVT